MHPETMDVAKYAAAIATRVAAKGLSVHRHSTLLTDTASATVPCSKYQGHCRDIRESYTARGRVQSRRRADHGRSADAGHFRAFADAGR